MNLRYKKILLLSIWLVWMLPAIAFAQAPGGSGIPTIPSTPSSPGMSVQLNNPLGNDTTIRQFFLKIIQIIIIFATPIIVFFIILAGFKYVTARGNASQIETATTSLTWAIVGGILILGAELILKVIEGTVQSLQ